jgi:uncharacterized coiled-coil protein SlyX
MAERSDQINKKDLELILDVNRRSIEIETERIEQNEEIISSLTDIVKTLNGVASNSTEVNRILERVKESTDGSAKVTDRTKEIVVLSVDNIAKVKLTQDEQSKALDKILATLAVHWTSIDKTEKKSEELSRSFFTLQVLLGAGLISLIIQVIQLFKH